MSEVSVKKQQAVQFVVRAPFHGVRTWAIYTLSEHGGTLSIQSDYGDFAHWWPERGEDFLWLMTDLDEDYFLRKLVGEPTRLLFEETVTVWREVILERRRSGRITEEVAREAWDGLDEAKKFSGDRDGLLNWMLDDGPYTEDFEEAIGSDWMIEGTYFDYTIGQKNLHHMFQQHVVPELKKELESRKAVTA